MNITSKFIYALTRTAFEREIPNIPEDLKPIVFIENTKEIWINGTYFSAGYPSITINEISGSVKVQIGDAYFTIQTNGASLNVRKGTGNNIIFNSSALTFIDTEAPLEWKSDTKQLLHVLSGVLAGTYGQSSSLNNASTFDIPNLIVDSYGHINEITNKKIIIRDYVEQLKSTQIAANRNILLSYNEVNDTSDTAQVRKADGLTYNDESGNLSVKGGIKTGGEVTINNGNLNVIGGFIVGDLQGNVTGEATPKIHLSEQPEYGGASLYLYGHVIVQDNLGVIAPPLSSDNADPTSATVTRGVAASPRMVWDTKQSLLETINTKPNIKGFIVGEDKLEITKPNQEINIVGENGIDVSIVNEGFVIKGINITGHNESNVEKTITNNLKLSKDFSVDSNNEMWIRWEEI